MDTSLETKLVEIISKINRAFKGKMFTNSDLNHCSMLQLQGLTFLSAHKNASMSEIAQYFSIKLSSATSLINNLCKMELAKRKEDSKDRRLVRITLTKKGE